MVDICCIGHITLDKVITPSSEVHMPGGTSFYFSYALHKMHVGYRLITALAEKEHYIVDQLMAEGLRVTALTSQHTVCFENIYSEDQDHRTQRVTQKADAFRPDQLSNVNSRIFHLGPLLADDIPLDVIKFLAAKGTLSLDVQGYLREVNNEKVLAIDWPEKAEALKFVDILKANDAEMEVLTGISDIYEGAKNLAAMGVKEVVITLGSKGSLIYSGGVFYEIPAYPPSAVVDATGCGDTYMAGYLFQRSKGSGIRESGEFAAAMASLKIETSGPFKGSSEMVADLLEKVKLQVR